MTPRIPADPYSDVMSAANSGESDVDSEYVELPKNSPTSSAKTSELEGRIQELQQMHEVTEDEINAIARPPEIFIHTNELDPIDLTGDGTTPTKTPPRQWRFSR